MRSGKNFPFIFSSGFVNVDTNFISLLSSSSIVLWNFFSRLFIVFTIIWSLVIGKLWSKSLFTEKNNNKSQVLIGLWNRFVFTRINIRTGNYDKSIWCFFPRFIDILCVQIYHTKYNDHFIFLFYFSTTFIVWLVKIVKKWNCLHCKSKVFFPLKFLFQHYQQNNNHRVQFPWLNW